MGLLNGALDPELNDVPISKAAANFGQTQRFLFFQLLDSNGNKNKFEPNHATTPTDPAVLNSWTTMLGAADETKPVPSPFVSDPQSEPGAKRTTGGGNATMNGVTISLGSEPQPVEGKFLNTSSDALVQKAIKALKTFQKGSGVGRSMIGVVPINQMGQMLFDSNAAPSLTDAGLELYPIPVHSLWISDKGFGGLEDVDYNMFSFEFAPDWSDDLIVVTPTDFNGLDLENT